MDDTHRPGARRALKAMRRNLREHLAYCGAIQIKTIVSDMQKRESHIAI